MSKIDWSKAPEGTTHWNSVNNSFYKIGGEFARVYKYAINEWENSIYKTVELDGAPFTPRQDFQPFTSIEDAQPAHDMVNHPPHYQSDNGIECIDAIRAALGRDGFIAYCIGNSMKYQWREKADKLEDMRKAAWYLNRAIEEKSK